MHRIDTANSVLGKFRDANPGAGTQATFFDADWCNDTQETICHPIEHVGITLDETKQDQLTQAIFEIAHPVGSVYIDNIGAQNPAQIFGYGTWLEICKGRVPVGLDTTQVEFNAIGKQGGEKTHEMTADELVGHRHGVRVSNHVTGGPSQQADGGVMLNENTPTNFEKDGTANTSNTAGQQIMSSGGGQPFNVMQPYEVIGRIWKRTA